MDLDNPNNDDNGFMGKGYALSGRIMLSAIVVLFFVVVMMVCLHLYARWYLLNARRRQLRRARTRRTQLVFYVDPANPQASGFTAPSGGLDAAVLKSLPLFVYSSKTHPDSIECAVCLSEFEENETGRVLPKCDHSFHIECIDMWFHSHSTCPICRSPVEPVADNPVSEIKEVGSGSCLPESHTDASTSSFNERCSITVEVPRRNGILEDESATESPSSYRSPMSRMLSFTRMLSRERKGNASSPSGNAVSGGAGSLNESDIEKGRDETNRTQIKLGGDSVV
ncbi:RING-H2 finger protein ATL2 [Mercurialis annua]|uniref:RING-H2 finger protein ATL2 n=1 Tax=Mercurialis annua TaxID=3986 RepID=UPI00215EE933|nr:RING-H2 finger protein ATL2 [Mercurialis annua]